LANYVNSPQVDPMDAFNLDKELEHTFTMLNPSRDTNDSGEFKSDRILLTGSCGYLGLQILHDLLQEKKTVYCLLRKTQNLNGLDRIKQRFQIAKFEWRDEYDSNIILVRITVRFQKKEIILT